jgi:hypothetical protein
MAARVFSGMGRVFQRTFKESGAHYWKRYDAAQADPIVLIFNAAVEVVDDAGVPVATGKPVAWITHADIQRLAPERLALPPDSWVDQRDRLTVNGRVYAVECCRFDGNAMCEVPLIGN